MKSYQKKYKIIWTKIEDLKLIELNAFGVYDEEQMAIKFMLTFAALISLKMRKTINILESFLLIFYFYLKANITCKYTKTIVWIIIKTFF